MMMALAWWKLNVNGVVANCLVTILPPKAYVRREKRIGHISPSMISRDISVQDSGGLYRKAMVCAPSMISEEISVQYSGGLYRKAMVCAPSMISEEIRVQDTGGLYRKGMVCLWLILFCCCCWWFLCCDLILVPAVYDFEVAFLKGKEPNLISMVKGEADEVHLWAR